MTNDFNINPSLLSTTRMSSHEYHERVTGALCEIINKGLRLDDIEESMVAMMQLYSSAMLGSGIGVGEQMRLRPDICAMYIIRVVSNIRIRRFSKLGRPLSADEQLLFDAHTQLYGLVDKVLEGDNWDGGIFGAFTTAAIGVLNLGDPQDSPM